MVQVCAAGNIKRVIKDGCDKRMRKPRMMKIFLVFFAKIWKIFRNS